MEPADHYPSQEGFVISDPREDQAWRKKSCSFLDREKLERRPSPLVVWPNPILLKEIGERWTVSSEKVYWEEGLLDEEEIILVSGMPI